MTMSEDQQKKKLHAEIMALWERYQALQKAMLVLQADIDKLDQDIRESGKKIYELYKLSSNGLNGELPKKSKIDNHKS